MAVLVLAAASVLLAPARTAAAKGGPAAAPEPPKTGVFQMPSTSVKYLAMSVPKDYDPAKFWPLLVILGSNAQGTKPEDFVAAWWDVMEKKGWILAGPALDVWEDEGSVQPLRMALDQVKSAYKIDTRRIVLAGHNSGASMAWRMATQVPDAWAAVVAFSGEISSPDRNDLKKVAGKPVYIFRGEKDTVMWNANQFDRDRKYLEAAKALVTAEVLPGWNYDLPRASMPKIADWVASFWPAGTYREKAAAVDEALKVKDLAGAMKAHAELMAELKKSPYPAFESKAADFGKAIQDLGRSLVADAKALVDADPLEALVRMEAAVKAVKGLKPVDAEASAALVALKKDPKVVAAQKKKEAEDQAAAWMKRGEAAEVKDDWARALECYRKVVALGDTSKKAEAESRIAEIEPKVPAGGMK